MFLFFTKNVTLKKTIYRIVNGALNIMKKSNVVSLTTLYARGEVDTPVRIRIS